MITEIIGDATLYLGDCQDILPSLEPVDAVVTDPPFGVGNFVQITGNIRGRGQGKGKRVDWNEAPPSEDIFRMIREISTHRIIWGANFFNCFEGRGGAIVWIKNQSMPNFSKADIASCTHLQKTEIVKIPWGGANAETMTDHPCERPVGLYQWCIKYLPYCETILDPFMGSGSTGVAALHLGRKFIGIEKEAEYFEIACKRISDAERQDDLFIQKRKPEQLMMVQ